MMAMRASARPLGCWEQEERIRQKNLRFRVKHLCCRSGIVPMMLPYYIAFALELVRHVGQYGGPGLAERIGRHLVAKWTEFGLKPAMLRELLYHLVNVRLEQGQV